MLGFLSEGSPRPTFPHGLETCPVFRVLIICLSLVALLAPSQSATAAATRTVKRDQIKAMPLLERPYRIGHVYGNTVRRRTH